MRTIRFVLTLACASSIACTFSLPEPRTRDLEALDGGGDADAGPDAGVAADMVHVPAAGAFLRGCNVIDDADCYSDEGPSGLVTLRDYDIDLTEVTQPAYQLCVAAG